MKRYVAVLSMLALAACGGGGSSAPHPVATPTATPVVSALKTGNVALSIKIPRRAVSASARRPKFIPSGAERLDVIYTGSASGTQSFNFETNCTNTAPDTFVCALNLAPGNYTLVAQMFDGPGVGANMLATSANVTPATSLTVAGGTQSAAISLQGIVHYVYAQTPLQCTDPTALSATGIPLRFLDADGQEIQGTFAYPVTISSDNPALIFAKQIGGGSVDGQAITSDPNVVDGTVYPTVPRYLISGDGVNEITTTLHATTTNPSGVQFAFGNNTSSPGASFTFTSAHHLLLLANQGSPNISITAVQSDGTTTSCGAIPTTMSNPAAIFVDGQNDRIVAAGLDSSTSTATDIAEYKLQPPTYVVSLTGSFPSTSLATGQNQTGISTGQLSLARSSATNTAYLGMAGAHLIGVINDGAFPTLAFTLAYGNGTPINMVVGAPLSIAVANSPANGDVLFVPDSGGGNVGIVTHAQSPGTVAIGQNFDLHSVTPDGSDPLPSYSMASYSNGSQRIISFMVNDNGGGQLHSFDANFVSIPTFNTAGANTPVANGNTLVTGTGDSDYFYSSVGNGVCFAHIGNPMGAPPICANITVSTIATSGDNTWIAMGAGSTIGLFNPSNVGVGIGPGVPAAAGAIPAFYTR